MDISALKDIFNNAMRSGLKDNRETKRRVKVRVLTRPVRVKIGTTDAAEWRCKGRIIEDDLRDNSHAFLPDPCDSGLQSGDDAALSSVQMHLLLTKTGPEQPDYSAGDIVIVALSPNEYTANLERAVVVETFLDRGTGQVDPEPWIDDCISLSSAFTDTASNEISSRSGPADDIEAEVFEDLDVENYLDQSVGRSGEDLKPTGITMHYTAGSTVSGAMATLKKTGFSYHFIIDRNGEIYQLTKTDRKAIHDPATNGTNIGISFINLGFERAAAPAQDNWEEGTDTAGNVMKWEPYPSLQIASGVSLVASLTAKYPNIASIVRHSDTSRSGKQDPGPVFPIDRFPFYLVNPTSDTPVANSDPPESDQMASEVT